jgi:hypothetical protein
VTCLFFLDVTARKRDRQPLLTIVHRSLPAGHGVSRRKICVDLFSKVRKRDFAKFKECTYTCLSIATDTQRLTEWEKSFTAEQEVRAASTHSSRFWGLARSQFAKVQGLSIYAHR